MRHIIGTIIGLIFLMTASPTAAATLQDNKATVKRPLLTEDLTQKTVKKRNPKLKKRISKRAKKSPVNQRKMVSHKKTNKKKPIKNRKVASKEKNKKMKYWSVQCHQGFIKDSYVYCARGKANVESKKLSHKNVANKKIILDFEKNIQK
jgi:hypothetical protein